MSERIEHQIIHGAAGEPLYVLVPYDEYVKAVAADRDTVFEKHGPTIPGEVIKAVHLDGKSALRAWREHLGLTQVEMAGRLGIKQGAYSQMERPGVEHRPDTLAKLAKALRIDITQLDI